MIFFEYVLIIYEGLWLLWGYKNNPQFLFFFFIAFYDFVSYYIYDNQREHVTNRNGIIAIQRYYNYLPEYFITKFILFLNILLCDVDRYPVLKLSNA